MAMYNCIEAGCSGEALPESAYCSKHSVVLGEIGRVADARIKTWLDEPAADKAVDTGIIRSFQTGATRDTASKKPQYSLYISPLVTKRYGQFMLAHQTQTDGTVRAGDNWQKGIPNAIYLDSAERHFLDWKLWERGFPGEMVAGIEETLCSLIFNASGQLHEILKAKLRASSQEVPTERP